MKFTDIISQKIVIPIWGDTDFRGNCPKESAEQMTFFNRVRSEYPDTWGKIATHIRNEGKKTPAQIQREKAEGLTTGASDIVIGGFYCELKRLDHTKCKISEDQANYLITLNKLGFYGCIALGHEAAWEAFQCYISTTKNGLTSN